MRLISIVVMILMAGQTLFSQDVSDTSYWSDGGKFGISFSQVGLSNWASGGDPSVSFSGLFSYGMKYEKEPNLWDTDL